MRREARAMGKTPWGKGISARISSKGKGGRAGRERIGQRDAGKQVRAGRADPRLVVWAPQKIGYSSTCSLSYSFA